MINNVKHLKYNNGLLVFQFRSLYLLLSIFFVFLLLQGCSSNIESTKVIESPGVYNPLMVSPEENVVFEAKLETTKASETIPEKSPIIDNIPQESSAEKNVSEIEIETIGAPKFMLESTIYDFGNIKPNSINTATFNYTNIGDKPLEIKNLQRCCGAIATLEKEQLAPGEIGTLTAQYSVGQGIGAFTRTISFSTNDPDKQQVKFTIKGIVIQTLEYSPASFEVSAYDQNIQCPEITIKSLDDTPFAIKSIASTNDYFKADFNPDSKAGEFVLKPTINAAQLKELTADKGTVTIELDHPDYKTISVNFTVIRSLQVNPTQILLFNARANEPITKTIQLKDNTADSSVDVSRQIESITLENGTKIEMKKPSRTASGCNLDLEIWPPAQGSSGAFTTDTMNIELKDGRQLSVPIRIFYSIREVSSATN